MEYDDIRVKKLIKKLAKSIDLCKNFDDIEVINDPDMPSVAGVRMEDNTLVINLGNKFFTFEELLRCIEGLVVHEIGHSDARLGIPSDIQTFDMHKDYIKQKKLGDKGFMWLNLVYDLEIHHQYNRKGYIKPKYQRKLKRFLTLARNKMFKKDPSDIILSMEYPTTKEHEMVKKIIENRNLDVCEKVTKLSRSRKLNPPKQNKGGGKGKNKAPNKTPITEILDIKETDNDDKRTERPVSIKGDIEQENKKAKIKKRLSSFGLSVAEIDAVLQRYPTNTLVKQIEWLEKSLQNILPNMEHETSMEKTKEKTKNKGTRIDGYRRINDIADITRNVEDFATVGEYDINEVRVPYRISRRCKGNVIIVRDVSGSVSGEPMATIVRDITVNLIEIAKKKRHKVGVIDFHSEVEPIQDSKGNVLTSEYTLLLIDSMKLKSGYNTRLDKVFEYINSKIVEKHRDIPLNIFIVTDGLVGRVEKPIMGKKTNLVGILIDEHGFNDSMFKPFNSAIKQNNGKVYKVSKTNENKMMSKLVKDFGV